MDIFFNGIKRDNKVITLNDKESAPNGHTLHIVILRLCTFLKKEPNVIAEGTCGVHWATRVSKTVEIVNLWSSLPLPTRFQNWEWHCWTQSSFLSLAITAEVWNNWKPFARKQIKCLLQSHFPSRFQKVRLWTMVPLWGIDIYKFTWFSSLLRLSSR